MQNKRPELPLRTILQLYVLTTTLEAPWFDSATLVYVAHQRTRGVFLLTPG